MAPGTGGAPLRWSAPRTRAQVIVPPEPSGDIGQYQSMPAMLRAKLAEGPSPERRRTFGIAAYRTLQDLITLPWLVLALYRNHRIDPAYGVTLPRFAALAWRMYTNSLRVFSASSHRAHLAMAAKLLEVPADVDGVVVECGSFLGGSAANLSLACELAGRELIVYDSFEGMPAADPNDRFAKADAAGAYRGSLETVRSTVGRLGAIDRCTFRKGWFADTLPDHDEPVVLCFLDVDWQASLHDCLVNLWPRLVERGFVFIDEYVLLDYCAAFYSERYWRTYFDTTPPGLYGAGTGVPLHQTYLGPFLAPAPLQFAVSVAYTWKGSSGYWEYFPEGGT